MKYSYAGLHRDIATAEINSCDSLQSAAGQLSQVVTHPFLLKEKREKWTNCGVF